MSADDFVTELAKLGYRVTYQDLNHDGPDNLPTWKCLAICGAIQVVGRASRKKDAQQAAAKAILNKLQRETKPKMKPELTDSYGFEPHNNANT